MKGRLIVKIMVAMLCLSAAGFSAWAIGKGDHAKKDIFYLVIFLLFASVNIHDIRKLLVK